MSLVKKVKQFETLACKVFYEDDFIKKNKIDEQIEKLVNTVYESGEEDEFYRALFSSKNPLALVEIALISASRNYDLYKSLEILEAIKHNAHNIIFFEEESKNKKWQEFFSIQGNTGLKEKIKFYEQVGDDFLFKSFYSYISLCSKYYDCYVHSKIQEQKKIFNNFLRLYEELKDFGKTDRFFAIVYAKIKEDKSKLNTVVTAYIVGKIGYDADFAKKTLSEMVTVKAKDLNPKMLKFTTELLAEIS